MTAIDRVGRYRGVPTGGIIRPTKNGFPQFIVNLAVTEMFDEETGEWVDWTDYDMSTTAFFVLFGKEKPIFHYPQVMAAFDWNGRDMALLQSEDYGDLIVSFYVEEDEYENVIRLKVNWIDTYDADPRQARMAPLDTGDIKALNAQYASMMVAAVAKVPAKAPAKARVAKASNKTNPPKAKAKGKAKAPKMPVSPPVTTQPNLDMEGAWIKVNEDLGDKTDSGTISAGWMKAVQEVSDASGLVDTAFGTDQWNLVVTSIMETLTV
jgi:hypothetical protein